jgi:alpha-beta hydrolase superfamily lysophospholipase
MALLHVVLCLLVVLNRSAALIQKLEEPTSAQQSHELQSKLFRGFEPGGLNKAIVRGLATELGTLTHGPYTKELEKFSGRTQFTKFETRDGLALQGYSMLHESCSSRPFLFFGVGYTETTIKYVHVLNKLYSEGYDVYSFDYRGQGFSASTGWNDYRDLRVNDLLNEAEPTHELSQDVVDYIGLIQKQDAARCRDSEHPVRPEPVYIGNSMGGILGYTTQRLYSELQPALAKDKYSAEEDQDQDQTQKNEGRLFSKLVLVVPCIEPVGVGFYSRGLIHFLSYVLPEWYQRELFIPIKDLDLKTQKLSHDGPFMAFWYTMRILSSKWLMSSGSSLNFIRWLTFNGADAILRGENDAVRATDIFVIMADDDRLVDGKRVGDFYEMLTMPVAGGEKQRGGKRKYAEIPNTYHEVWGEGPRVTQDVLGKVLDFIRL